VPPSGGDPKGGASLEILCLDEAFAQAATLKDQGGADDGEGVRFGVFLLLLMFLGSGGGCQTAMMPFSQDHVEMRDYKPLSIPASSPVRARWVRLQRLAAAEAWRLETFDETRGLMIAARASHDSNEVREHLRIVLRADTTEISVQTEILEDGEWDARDLTCGRYEYSRESEIAMKLE